MDINSAFPSTFLKASDLNGKDVTVTIDRVEIQEVGGDHLPVCSFVNTTKGLCLNKTNSNTIAGLYGSETDNWHGKRITLFPTQTDYQGKQVPCIRVRLQAPAGAPPNAEQVESLNNEALDNDSIPF